MRRTSRVMRRGERVLLRPYRAGELDAMEAAMSSEEARDWLPLGPPPRHELRRRVDARGAMSEGRIDLAIEADGRLIGEIDARHPKWALPPDVWEIGITLFSRADRGRGYGREALTLLCGRLFEDEGARRVSLSTDLENTAMRTVAERCGFHLEGVLRSYMPVGDERRDYALYGMTKDDWAARADREAAGAASHRTTAD